MPSYLITWKPATENKEKGWPVEELIALSEKVRQRGAAQETWPFLRRKGVRVGERVFVVRQGRSGWAILGYGEVARIPNHNDGHMTVSLNTLTNPISGTVLATQDELRGITTKRGVWDTRASGITLAPDVASALESLVVDRKPVPDVPIEAAGARWSLEELRAAVESYRDMQRALRAGKEVNKKAIYRDLSRRFGRTEKAYEYRMQNISYVLFLHGRSWIPGLVPARNVGTTVAADIEEVLAQLERRQINRALADKVQVQNNVAKGHLPKPPGARAPRATTTETTQYDRDPDVQAWVLIAAKGKCECCKKKAPFTTAAGTPYLEVHHVRKLADGGSDMVENAVALCPNCHRRLHYGRDSDSFVRRLLSQIDRLIKE